MASVRASINKLLCEIFGHLILAATHRGLEANLLASTNFTLLRDHLHPYLQEASKSKHACGKPSTSTLSKDVQ